MWNFLRGGGRATVIPWGMSIPESRVVAKVSTFDNYTVIYSFVSQPTETLQPIIGLGVSPSHCVVCVLVLSLRKIWGYGFESMGDWKYDILG